jgi:glycosyltransferase involved in cell wall biosynthesis
LTNISVIIPVFNTERLVAEAIRSVLAQTHEDFELILVDDGSTDGSAAVCAGFDDPRIRLVRQQNRGLAGARNAGIRHARGDLLAFLDADDAWMPDKLVRHLDHLGSHPEVGVSFSHSALMDDAGRLTGRYQTPPGGDVSPGQLLMDNPVANGSTPVVRREALDAIAFDRGERCWFDPELRRVEDLDCWLRIALSTSWRIACLPEVLTVYRLSSAGLSTDGAAMLADWQRVLERARALDPELIGAVERPARARLLRYLSGRAVRARQPDQALHLIVAALRTDVAILWQQPRASWLTLAAAVALSPYRLRPGTE